jgi:hypothetical protein
VDIKKTIIADIAADPAISARGISLEVSRKGFLKEKKILRVYGMVPSGAHKDRVLKLVQRHAGDHYLVIDNLFVSECSGMGNRMPATHPRASTSSMLSESTVQRPRD